MEFNLIGPIALVQVVNAAVTVCLVIMSGLPVMTMPWLWFLIVSWLECKAKIVNGENNYVTFKWWLTPGRIGDWGLQTASQNSQAHYRYVTHQPDRLFNQFAFSTTFHRYFMYVPLYQNTQWSLMKVGACLLIHHKGIK